MPSRHRMAWHSSHPGPLSPRVGNKAQNHPSTCKGIFMQKMIISSWWVDSAFLPSASCVFTVQRRLKFISISKQKTKPYGFQYSFELSAGSSGITQPSSWTLRPQGASDTSAETILSLSPFPVGPLSLEGGQHLFPQRWGISRFRATANHRCGAEGIAGSHVRH